MEFKIEFDPTPVQESFAEMTRAVDEFMLRLAAAIQIPNHLLRTEPKMAIYRETIQETEERASGVPLVPFEAGDLVRSDHNELVRVESDGTSPMVVGWSIVDPTVRVARRRESFRLIRRSNVKGQIEPRVGDTVVLRGSLQEIKVREVWPVTRRFGTDCIGVVSFDSGDYRIVRRPLAVGDVLKLFGPAGNSLMFVEVRENLDGQFQVGSMTSDDPQVFATCEHENGLPIDPVRREPAEAIKDVRPSRYSLSRSSRPELVAFLRTYAPTWLGRSGWTIERLSETLSEPGSVARTLFELGREYAKQIDTEDLAKQVLANAAPRLATAIFAVDPEVIRFLRERSEASYEPERPTEEEGRAPAYLKAIKVAWSRREPKGARERAERLATAVLSVLATEEPPFEVPKPDEPEPKPTVEGKPIPVRGLGGAIVGHVLPMGRNRL